MKILKQAIKVKRHSRVQVEFSRPCTVYMMTEVNFKRYKDGASFRRVGGAYDKSPVEFIAPYDGTWYVVIEKGSHYSPKAVDGKVTVSPPLMKTITLWDDDIEPAKSKKQGSKKEENQDSIDVAVADESDEDQSDAENEEEEDN